METKQVKPSGWFYVLGLMVLLFGCVGAIAVFAFGIAGTVDSAIDVDRQINEFERVVVPGSAQLVLDEAGSYVIFYEYSGVLDGVPFNSSRSQPRLNCELQNKASGNQVPLYDVWLQDANYQLLDRSGTMLMRFDVDRPDTYVLTCGYAGSGDAPEAVLAIGTGFWQMAVDLAVHAVTILIAPVLLFFGLGIIALVILVTVALMRHQSARRLEREVVQSTS